MIAQAPADLFAGALSLRSCRDLPLKRPLCPGNELKATPRADGKGVDLAAATRLKCHGSRCRSKAIPPAARRSRLNLWRRCRTRRRSRCPRWRMRGPPSRAGCRRRPWPIKKSRHSGSPSRRLRRASPTCPLLRERAAGTGELFAVFLSGDGGWAGIDKNVAASLVARGVSVAGVDSLRYFWTARTAQGLAGDVDRVVRYYAYHWRKKRALLIGFSQGADVLPFAINRLPAATRRRVVLAAMLGPDERADFEFHLSNWGAERHGRPAGASGGAEARHTRCAVHLWR